MARYTPPPAEESPSTTPRSAVAPTPIGTPQPAIPPWTEPPLPSPPAVSSGALTVTSRCLSGRNGYLVGAGRRVLLHGKVERAGSRLRMEHPLHEILQDDAPSETLNFGRIVPIYPTTGTLGQSVWRKAMAHALDTRLDLLEEPLPPNVVAAKSFPGIREAVRAMHFPHDAGEWRLARRRLAWDECFFLQLAVLAARRHALHDLPGRSFAIGPELDSRIRRLFPFRLTPAQDRSVREIARDMASPLPMQRLLQGDVGSGKTAVAAYALLVAVANKAQACIMAPTSLLARQHHATFERFLANSPNSRVHMGVLVGGMPAAERRVVLERLANGSLDIICN